MNLYLILSAAADTPDRGKLILEYAVYTAIIIVGILILLLLRRAGKLPKHGDLRKQFAAFSEELTAFSKDAASLSRYQFFRKVNRFLYRAERLALTASQLAIKERDGDIDRAAGCMSSVRDLLAPYKFSKQAGSNHAAIANAVDKANTAVNIMDKILARDAELKSRNRKKA